MSDGRLEYLATLEVRIRTAEERFEERFEELHNLLERKVYAVIETLENHVHSDIVTG